MYQYNLADEPEKEAKPAAPPVVLVPSDSSRGAVRSAGGDNGGGIGYPGGADSASLIPDWIAALYPGTGHSAARLSGGVAAVP